MSGDIDCKALKEVLDRYKKEEEALYKEMQESPQWKLIMKELQQYFKCVTGHEVKGHYRNHDYKYLILPLATCIPVLLRYECWGNTSMWYIYWEDGETSSISNTDISEVIVSHAYLEVEAWRLAAHRWFS